MNRCPNTRPGIDDNCATKPLYPLLHPEESHPPSAFGLETASIVRDLELNSVAGLGQVHQNILRMSMTPRVIQRLLYHSEQTNFHFIRQMFETSSAWTLTSMSPCVASSRAYHSTAGTSPSSSSMEGRSSNAILRTVCMILSATVLMCSNSSRFFFIVAWQLPR